MRRAAFFGLALLVSACGGGGFFDRMFSGSSAPTVTCPEVSKVADVARLTRFVPGGRDLTDVAFEAAVGKLGGNCSRGEGGSVDVQLTVEFIGSRGPADKTRKAPFAYFVAIVDRNDNILAREQFDTGIGFPGNQSRNAITEELDENIPLQKDQQGNQFRVFVGFVLTPEEIAYNRAHP